MDAQIGEGLRIMAVGIAGVFANLALLMIVVSLFGVVLGRKKQQKKEPRSAQAAG
jgi:Na+-transporting methylmalonyl-CoA/oxaloacetate decarboxylase gamma subunit